MSSVRKLFKYKDFLDIIMETLAKHLEDLPNYASESSSEEYMSRQQLEHFKNKLISWKKILIQEAGSTIQHIQTESQSLPDELDRATMEEDFRLELRTREREHKLIRKIDQALLRIETGDYGYCKETGDPIGLARLDARPTADLCIAAKARMEQREKQGLPS